MRKPLFVLSVVGVLVGFGSTSAGSAPSTSWKVVAAAGGNQAVVATASTRRATRFAVRVFVTGDPKRAEVVAFVACGVGGPGVLLKRTAFTVRAPATRVLSLPMSQASICGVTVFGYSSSVVSVSGNTVTGGQTTVQILVPVP
jgi:hypothetical protein